jgi:hypothetical protein
MKNSLSSRIFGIGLLVVVVMLAASSPHLFSKETGSFVTNASFTINDDQMLIEFELINQHSNSQLLQFGSGQQYEIIVTNDKGEEVYRYSDGKMFTMALVYREIKPGEALRWQENWDLTDKNGEKLTSGNYKIEIQVLTGFAHGDAAVPTDQLIAVLDLDLAESIIKETADQAIRAIRDQDAEKLAALVHPEKGVRFTPYTYVSVEQDLVFNQEAIKNFFTDDTIYHWGYFDGTGWDILMTPNEYYRRFIYSHDFVNAEQIGYNEVLSFGNMLQNQFEVYENPIIVEYYFSGFNPDYAGMDWKSLRLVFEHHVDGWKLVGIIHNEWTI